MICAAYMLLKFFRIKILNCLKLLAAQIAITLCKIVIVIICKCKQCNTKHFNFLSAANAV